MIFTLLGREHGAPWGDDGWLEERKVTGIAERCGLT